MMRHSVQCMIWVVTVLLSIPLSSESQSPRPKLEGMWSDPPSSAVGAFCTFACTDAGLDRLNALYWTIPLMMPVPSRIFKQKPRNMSESTYATT